MTMVGYLHPCVEMFHHFRHLLSLVILINVLFFVNVSQKFDPGLCRNDMNTLNI